jgi:hypothetical protein
VLENPSTGKRCTVDAKVDTGSFATVISLSLGDFSFTHHQGKDGQLWIQFKYEMLEDPLVI